MANSNEYMREYMLKRYHTRREQAIEKLGGKCAICGTTEDLEIDHIDPSTKSMDLGRAWSYSQKRYDKEIELCQLLCYDCHKTKSGNEHSVDHGKGLTGKRNCYCDLCKPLKRAYNIAFRKSRT